MIQRASVYAVLLVCLVVPALSESSSLTLLQPHAKIHKRQQPEHCEVCSLQKKRRNKSNQYHPFLGPEPSAMALRGGEDIPMSDELPGGRKRRPSFPKTVTIAGAVIASLWLLWTHREGWMALFDKEKLQSRTLEILHSMNSFPKYQSYTMYALGMAIWETGGLSTIPVETAAGMVFGWDGVYLSSFGKLLGAVLAFCLGRYGILADWVHKKLANNEFLDLLKKSTETNPLLVSILLKLSCFPETIKNYGSAVLHPIKLWMFIFATGAHGGTFSALWTYLGVDAAKRLEDPSYPTDRRLGILLTLALINGIVVSPLAMGVWIRNLRATRKKGKLQ